MIYTESGMTFDFTGFDSASPYDTRENQCAGLKIVDFVADDSEKLFLSK
jgi:hypothetical protein